MSSNRPQQSQQSPQQVAGRSTLTIHVGTSSDAASTSSTGCGMQVHTSPLAAPAAAAASDAGRHGNPSQQAADDSRSAVNITNTIIVARITFYEVSYILCQPCTE